MGHCCSQVSGPRRDRSDISPVFEVEVWRAIGVVREVQLVLLIGLRSCVKGNLAESRTRPHLDGYLTLQPPRPLASLCSKLYYVSVAVMLDETGAVVCAALVATSNSSRFSKRDIVA